MKKSIILAGMIITLLLTSFISVTFGFSISSCQDKNIDDNFNWNIEHIGEYHSGDLSYASSIFIKDNHAYVTDHDTGLHILEVSDPANPLHIGHFGSGEDEVYDDVFVKNDNSNIFAYVLDSSHDSSHGLHIIDVTDPTNPFQKGTYPSFPGVGCSIFIKGNYAYVSDDINLYIIDVKDPLNPFLVKECYSLWGPQDIFVKEDYIYIADRGRLHIMDISNPEETLSVGSCKMPEDTYAESIFVENNYAYVVLGDSSGGSVQIIDVENPAYPYIKTSYRKASEFLFPNLIYVQDGYAYIAFIGETLNSKIRIIDATNPNNPKIPRDAGSYFVDMPLSIFVQGDYAYVTYSFADMIGGLYVFSFTGKGLPYKPSIPHGQISGSTDTEYSYTAGTTDPNEDRITYLFDWGDGTDSGWTKFVISGETISKSHKWNSEGNYDVRVKAKDTNGAESEWSDSLSVSMPKNKAVYNPFLDLLNNYLNRYPILKTLLKKLILQ